MNSLVVRYSLAIILWIVALLLIAIDIKVSFQLWQEAVHKRYHLTLNQYLPMVVGIMVGAAIVMVIIGLIVVIPSAIGLLGGAFMIACIVGFFAGLNIFIRQRATRK